MTASKLLSRLGIGGIALAFLLSALDLMLLISLPAIIPALIFLGGVGLLVAARRIL
ncbi:MAG: hypothetical protein R3200_11065 [Xanthomonadales bacterium]|nr:hypothetical protein [Xanthomonadales bacterium]